ncbi:MAG: 4-hydroxy-tetrahydrodipicolinate reductase [Deltaproteobacteria bacterium]|nr:MAG: 4-hydroxy-tetrahydrodipicolinate reductase [Deltaproteobacteria bacterium]
MTTPHLLLFGARGRMGTSIAQIASERGIPCTSAPAGDLPHPPHDSAPVVVDFSGPGEAERALQTAVDLGVPFVGGTTGLGEAFEDALDDAARTVPVLWASNMSLGIAVLHRLVREAARMLPTSYDVELVELHHRRKKDAPSGTALTLAEAARDMRGGNLRTAREGLTGPRDRDEIGAFGVRGGEVVGEHTVYFLGDADRIELTHRARDRSLFASGAVEAARWIVGQRPGRFTIDDVLDSPTGP